MTGNHEMYKVFTPFKNARLKRIKDGIPECVSAPKMRDSGALTTSLSAITLSYPQQDFDAQRFVADEKLAIAQLRHFASRRRENTSSSVIFLRLTGLVDYPRARRQEDYHRASA